jgi:hypothetical protein
MGGEHAHRELGRVDHVLDRPGCVRKTQPWVEDWQDSGHTGFMDGFADEYALSALGNMHDAWAPFCRAIDRIGATAGANPPMQARRLTPPHTSRRSGEPQRKSVAPKVASPRAPSG